MLRGSGSGPCAFVVLVCNGRRFTLRSVWGDAQDPDKALMLHLLVYDWDRMGKNELVGETSVKLAGLVHPTNSRKKTVCHIIFFIIIISITSPPVCLCAVPWKADRRR